MNNIVIAGYLGADAEVREIGNDRCVVHYRVAVTRKWKGKDGSKQEQTTWFQCDQWNARALAPYLKKGTYLMVQGSMECRKHEEKYYWSLRVGSVDFIPRASSNDDSAQSAAPSPAEQEYETQHKDLPF